MAIVVLPVPPFWATSAIVFMAALTHVDMKTSRYVALRHVYDATDQVVPLEPGRHIQGEIAAATRPADMPTCRQVD
jgi:hypothetical protein